LAKKKRRLTIQCDELWSFVGNKGNKQWVELALDVESGEITGVFVGKSGSCWSKRTVAVATSECIANVLYAIADFWEAYERVIPSSRHRVVGKDSGKTKGIERFNCTQRLRISRQRP